MAGHTKNKYKGFTLIELMITVAIIGILASIAIPNYQDSVKKSRRADAEGALMGLANSLERKYTENNNYCNQGGASGSNSCGDTDATNDTGSTALLPDSTYYLYKIESASSSSYSISATPRSAQSSDKCGVLSLDNVGNRIATKGSNVVSDPTNTTYYDQDCKW